MFQHLRSGHSDREYRGSYSSRSSHAGFLLWIFRIVLLVCFVVFSCAGFLYSDSYAPSRKITAKNFENSSHVINVSESSENESAAESASDQSDASSDNTGNNSGKSSGSGKTASFVEQIDWAESEFITSDGRFTQKLERSSAASFSISLLDVEQGLAVLICADGHYMLYDGGGRDTSSYVVASLKNADITELDYIVASHYDEDHLAGLIGVLNTTQVDEVICPDYEADSKIYTSFEKQIKSMKVTHPEADDTFELGDAKITVLSSSWEDDSADSENESESESASETAADTGTSTDTAAAGSDASADDTAVDDGTYENNQSIVIRIEYGNYSCLITGDAEAEVEEDLLDSGVLLDSDLYIAGHHGSSSSSSEDFIDAVSPEWVFISCGEDNSYGHPTEQTLKTLEDAGAKLFRTDKQGPVIFYTDGVRYCFNTTPTDDWTPGTVPAETSESSAAESSASDQSSANAAGQDTSGQSSANDSGQDTSKNAASGSSGTITNGSGSNGSTEYTYVLNTNSHKFHYPDCESARAISDHNRKYSNESRDTLISEGYSPCGNCNP